MSSLREFKTVTVRTSHKQKIETYILIKKSLRMKKSTIKITYWTNGIKQHEIIQTNYESFVGNTREWFSQTKIVVK